MQSLLDWELQAMRAINKKFAALQRLAQLVEQMGDLTTWLPNLGKLLDSLPSVADLDFDLYTQLQTSCPFLNLPPFTNQALGDLKSKLNAAYGQLLNQIAGHPWSRLDKLQGMMNDFMGKVNYPYGQDYLQCANAICGAIQSAGSTLTGLANADIGNELKAFTKNFVTQGGNVLSEPMRTKRDEAFSTYNAIQDLRDESIQDFTTLTTTGETVPNRVVRLGESTGVQSTFSASVLAESGFPPTWPTSGLATEPGSYIPRSST